MNSEQMSKYAPGLYRAKTGYLLIYPPYVSTDRASFFNLDGVRVLQCSRHCHIMNPVLVPENEWSVLEWDGPFAKRVKVPPATPKDGVYSGDGVSYIRYDGAWYVKMLHGPRYLGEFVKPL